MGLEEQKEEREVLDSIFPDEITDISDTEYRIEIRLDVPENDESEIQPVIILQVAYPPDYPDIAPTLDISAPPNAPKHPKLDITDDKATLLSALESTVEENLGMPMIFTVYSALKDSAELLIAERQKAVEALLEIENRKAEEVENAKFHGTSVTRESFLAWRDAFVKEMEDEDRRRVEEKEAEDAKKRVKKEEPRMTGREIWEKGLAGKEDEEEGEDGGDGLAGGVEKLKVET